MFRILAAPGLLAGAALFAAGCSSSMMSSSGMMNADLETQLLSVSPRGGAIGVAATSGIVFTFNRPMMTGMEQYVVLHLGGVTGAELPMRCTWSGGQRTLGCRPDQPLAPATRFTVHLGGGMMDAEGRGVGMERFGMGMGGQWATGGMMGGQSGMMGAGWMHGNGSYGMLFEFTTQ